MREVAASLRNKGLNAAAAALQFQLLARRSSQKAFTERKQEKEYKYNHLRHYGELNSANTCRRVRPQTFKHSNSAFSSLECPQWQLHQHVRALSSTPGRKPSAANNPTNKPSTVTMQASSPRHAPKAASQSHQPQTLHIPQPADLEETDDVPIITLRSSRFRLPGPLYEETAKPSYNTIYNGFSVRKASKNAISNSFFAQLGRELDHVGTGYSAGKSMYQVARESYNSSPRSDPISRSQTSMSTSTKVLAMAFGFLIWLSAGFIVYSGILKTDNTKEQVAAQQNRTLQPAKPAQDFGPVVDDSRSKNAGTITRSEEARPRHSHQQTPASQLQTQSPVGTLESATARAIDSDLGSVFSIEAETGSIKKGANGNTGMPYSRNASGWYSGIRFW